MANPDAVTRRRETGRVAYPIPTCTVDKLSTGIFKSEGKNDDVTEKKLNDKMWLFPFSKTCTHCLWGTLWRGKYIVGVSGSVKRIREVVGGYNLKHKMKFLPSPFRNLRNAILSPEMENLAPGTHSYAYRRRSQVANKTAGDKIKLKHLCTKLPTSTSSPKSGQNWASKLQILWFCWISQTCQRVSELQTSTNSCRNPRWTRSPFSSRWVIFSFIKDNLIEPKTRQTRLLLIND